MLREWSCMCLGWKIPERFYCGVPGPTVRIPRALELGDVGYPYSTLSAALIICKIHGNVPRMAVPGFSLSRSSLSLSDPDIFGTLTPSSPPFEYHQQEANRCAKVELHPPSADIVRSSVGLPPVVSANAS